MVFRHQPPERAESASIAQDRPRQPWTLREAPIDVFDRLHGSPVLRASRTRQGCRERIEIDTIVVVARASQLLTAAVDVSWPLLSPISLVGYMGERCLAINSYKRLSIPAMPSRTAGSKAMEEQ